GAACAASSRTSRNTEESTMQGSYLRFYVPQGYRLHGVPLWDWLLHTANKMKIRGGSAFHAMAGFGHHHRMHEDRFFELAGSIGVEVGVVVHDAPAAALPGLRAQ